MTMTAKNRLGTAGDAVSSGAPGRGWNSMQNALRVFRKRWYIFLIVFLIAFAALCGYHCMKSRSTASTILSLDYEEASRGLTPNETRFNIFEIRGREVMERLISYAGLEGKITPEELGECVSVQATHDRNISGSVNYISTSFVVKFTNNEKISGRTAEDMLELLCKAYREYFVEHYGYNHSILSFDVSDLKFNDEYIMAVDLLELRCSQLKKYVQLRRHESKNYQDPDTGITFSDLEQRVSNFYAYDLAKLRSFVIENGIVNDKEQTGSMLNYKVRMDSLMYSKLMAAYDEDNKGIEMYDAAMSAVVMIPTQDQSNNYYMSRTRTGMDSMANHAREQLTGATERMEKIKYSTYLTEKLEAAAADKANTEKADAMIQEAEATLTKLATDIQAVDSAYTSAKARNYIGFSEDSVGLTQQFGLVRSFLGAVLLLIVIFFWVCLIGSFRRKEVAAA